MITTKKDTAKDDNEQHEQDIGRWMKKWQWTPQTIPWTLDEKVTVNNTNKTLDVERPWTLDEKVTVNTTNTSPDVGWKSDSEHHEQDGEADFVLQVGAHDDYKHTEAWKKDTGLSQTCLLRPNKLAPTIVTWTARKRERMGGKRWRWRQKWRTLRGWNFSVL